jgi:hypothetical protein
MEADDPQSRRTALVKRILEARQRGETVVFEADGDRVEYGDRRLRVELAGDERERLDDVLEAFHVFKPEQPATRKAGDGVVYLSAVTDAKHAADFVEALFREVYGADEGYELGVAQP